MCGGKEKKDKKEKYEVIYNSVKANISCIPNLNMLSGFAQKLSVHQRLAPKPTTMEDDKSSTWWQNIAYERVQYIGEPKHAVGKVKLAVTGAGAFLFAFS